MLENKFALRRVSIRVVAIGIGIEIAMRHAIEIFA